MSNDSLAERLTSIEDKWQTRWADAGTFECEPTADEKFYITVAYPYPSGGMHIGHIRTYMLPDVFARFKRMQGINVLFPMAWHVTGTPIVGILNRIMEGDDEQIQLLRDVYNVPEETLESFTEPMDVAEYFVDTSYRPNIKRLGFSVDWRREFTTNDASYNRFIEWQYRRLHDQGFLKQGLHPTKYDLHDENPVTEHDLLEGEGAQRQEFTVVEFEHDDYRFPAATLRPETVVGVTHLHVDPSETYRIASVDGQRWLLSEEATVKFAHQDHEVTVEGEVAGAELIGETVRNPVTGETVPVLPASFVDTDFGTGLVMSVPAHAPYDWIALRDLQAAPERLREYGVAPSVVTEIKPVSIIDVPEYSRFPARDACEAHGVESQDDEAPLEAATDEVYQAELAEGRLTAAPLAGESVEAARETVSERFEGSLSSLYDFTEEVIARSGGKVIVSLEQSWFLAYGDEEWKELVREQLAEVDVIPSEKRQEYADAIEWLENWPCIRNFGLGTKLPFDEEFVVEPLSDSTIYMAFYTISHLIEDVDPERLDPVFFDYVFNGEGSREAVVEATGIDGDVVRAARESFDYWYPLDYRTTAYELIRNHLTFMLFHHAALFDPSDWVEGIATWGMVLLENKKMSSSRGHVILAETAIERHSADIIRFHLFASNEPWQDFNWDTDEAYDRWDQLRRFERRTRRLLEAGVEREPTLPDRFVLSEIQDVIERATAALEEFKTRRAIQAAFFELNELITTYTDRVETPNASVLSTFVETQLRLMAPFTPHLCEELWQESGGESFVATSEWPTPDDESRDPTVTAQHTLLDQTIEDVRELQSVVGDSEEIRIVLAADWKRELFEELSTVVAERPSFGDAMSELVAGREQHGEQISAYLETYLSDAAGLPDRILDRETERAVFETYRSFLERRFDATVEITTESACDHERADRAEPGQPAIII